VPELAPGLANPKEKAMVLAQEWELALVHQDNGVHKNQHMPCKLLDHQWGIGQHKRCTSLLGNLKEEKEKVSGQA